MRDREPKEEIIETSKVLYGEVMYEQIYDPEKNISQFIGWDADEDKIIRLPHIDHAPKKFLPIKDESLEKGAVILPTDAIEYENEDELEFEINTFIEAWLDISEDHRQKATWYVMLSWITDNLHTIPYLRALGDYGTGKTRYLDVIGGLCYKPMFVGGSVRSAPIFRVIDLWRGTAIFDEFTLKQSDETQDIIQILNNGYQRGKPVLRCASKDYDKVKTFDPFGPKILATRKRFKDRALESRCISEVMKETSKSVPIDLTKQFYENRNELQKKLLMFRFRNWNEVNTDEIINVDFGSILPRIKQSFSPFVVLFSHNRNRLDEFIKFAKKHNRLVIEENSLSFDGQIFNHYLKLLEQHDAAQQHLDDYHEPTITSSMIKNSMVEDGWKEDDINSRTIGKHLSILGFESTIKKVEGKTVRTLNIDNHLLNSLKLRYVVT